MDGMYRKNNSAVRETQCGGGTGPSTGGYKASPKVHRAVLGVGGVHSTVRRFTAEDMGQHNP